MSVALHERILDRTVCGPNGCMIFTGTPSQRYPTITRRHLRAYKVVYEALVGPIPKGLQLDHLCFNTRCVNPNHLEPVTERENILRGSGLAAQNARKTHCKNGHPFDERNTRWVTTANGNPGRYCRTCGVLAQRRYRLRKKTA